MAKLKPNLRIGKRRVKGEPWVWLSGGAVATGIVMIIGMLLLIGVEGMVAFWPNDIEAMALGAPRYVVHHETQGQAWVSQDDESIVFQSSKDAYRTLDDKPYTGDFKQLRAATMLDYATNPTLFDAVDVEWVVRDAAGNLVEFEGKVVTLKSGLANAARYLVDIGRDQREHEYGISDEDIKPDTKLNADQREKLLGKLTIEHPKMKTVYLVEDGKLLCLRVDWKYLDGKPVGIDFKQPRQATIADYREHRSLFQGDVWLLADNNGAVVTETDGENVVPVKAAAFIDNPDRYPSPWGYLDEQGKQVPVEKLFEDDRYRDYQMLVGTVRGERAMDVRELPRAEDGTPVKPYQLDTQPKELLVRQGNQGEDLYGRDAYFRWVRTDIPRVEELRRTRESAYAETVLARKPLPGAVLIERLEKGVLTGFVTRVTVKGEVLADIETDGREKVLEVFREQQEQWHEEYKTRYAIEKHDLGRVNFELKDAEDTLRRIRYEHRDSRELVGALEALEVSFKEWQALEPLDKEYPTSADYDKARDEWLEKLPGILETWQQGLGSFELSADADEPLKRARAVQEERAEIQAGDFARLRYEVNRMRFEESEATFTFQTPDGLSTELVLAHVVRAFQPNEMGFFGKLGTYGGRVWEFLTDDPREANTEGGIWPVIIGTLIMTLLMCVAVVPFGVISALYLREYAKQGPLVSAVRIAVNNLAGVPSIVFGIFGLGFFCVMVGGSVDDLFFPELQPAPVFGGGGILWASLTLALLTVPVVIVSTEESLSAVPSSQREASLACGASKFQTIWKVVLPQALPGVLTGTILAMARGAGEVAPLMLVGAVKYAPYLPVDGTAPLVHLERKFMHLGFHIYDVGFQSPNVDNTKPLVFATALVLIILVGVLNVFAIKLRNRLRKKFATSHV